MEETNTRVTRDGSPVPIYAAVPLEPEFTAMLEAITPPATVLDLGCGAGRLANHLAAEGFTVTAVDESAEMLAHLRPDVTGVRSRIEDLKLDQHDIVVLSSHLINVPDRGMRQELLRAALTHTRPGGAVYIKHHHSSMLDRFTDASAMMGPVRISHRLLERRGLEFDAEVTYTLDDESWTQAYTGRILDEAALRAELELAGLALRGRLSPTWIVARPA